MSFRSCVSFAFPTLLLLTLVHGASPASTKSVLSPGVAAAEASLARCVRRAAPAWGSDACGGAPTGAQVELTNGCEVPVRVHWCVREESGREKCGVAPSLAVGNTTQAQSCQAKRPLELRLEVCEAGGTCRVPPLAR